MSETVLTVPVSISRRIEKLAQEAGRTPLQVLKFVLRDGLEYTEYAVQEANAGLHELAAGRGVPIDQVRQRRAARSTSHAA